MPYKIIKSPDLVPDDTYFTLADVEPKIEGNVITVPHGHGTWRSWGWPQANTTVLYNGKHICALLVGYSHKHRGGFGYFYYCDGVRIRWYDFSEKDRRTLLKRWAHKAPDWALDAKHRPGKLRSERAAKGSLSGSRQEPKIGYKLVRYLAVEETGFVQLASLYMPAFTYELGEDAGASGRAGPLYSFLSVEACREAFKTASWIGADICAVVKCEVWGRRKELAESASYGPKIATPHLRPLEIVEILERGPRAVVTDGNGTRNVYTVNIRQP